MGGTPLVATNLYEIVDLIYDAWVSGTSIGAIAIKKNAAQSGAASIHIITPSGVTLDSDLKIATGNVNNNLFHTTVMYNSTNKQFYVDTATLANRDQLPTNDGKMVYRTLYGGNAIPVDCNTIINSKRLEELKGNQDTYWQE